MQHILGERQLKSIRNDMETKGIILNITGRDKHVPEIERYICKVKEKVRATVNTLPFEHLLILEDSIQCCILSELFSSQKSKLILHSGKHVVRNR